MNSAKVLKEDIAYADDLLTRCESLPDECVGGCNATNDSYFEDDQVVFGLEKDSDVFCDDNGEDLMFLGFTKSNGKPLPHPSEDSIEKAKSILGPLEQLPKEAYESCGFKNGKGEVWDNNNNKK